jgi:hypothetical protein
MHSIVLTSEIHMDMISCIIIDGATDCTKMSISDMWVSFVCNCGITFYKTSPTDAIEATFTATDAPIGRTGFLTTAVSYSHSNSEISV